MTSLTSTNDAVHWFLSDLGCRVVAETGIPSDKHHFGKLILRSLKDAPDFVLQALTPKTRILGAYGMSETGGLALEMSETGGLALGYDERPVTIDGATGKTETFQSVLERSVRCATGMKNMGVKQGDTIVLMAPNNLDLAIPFYASLYLGNPFAPLDPSLGAAEAAAKLDLVRPTMIFCQNTLVPIIKKINHESTIISFGDSDCINFDDFLKKYGVIDDVDTFKAVDFDPTETLAILVSTSGSTGVPKLASLSHMNYILPIAEIWQGYRTFPTPTRMAIIASPLHWLSASIQYLLSPILRYTRLQSSLPSTREHFGGLINSYRPTMAIMSPTFLIGLIQPGEGDRVDITSFDFLILGGSAVPQDLLQEIRALTPKTRILGAYGMSETGGLALYDERPVPGSMGRPMGLYQYRLIDIETKEDITEPHVKGELWIKGPSVSKGYYNSPEATKEAFEDGWLKTGDIFYRDENYFFFFVERLKLLLKYKNYQVSPVEVELVIRQHPSVLDVAVTGVPEREVGDLVVACVVRKLGLHVTASEIKDLVKNSLSDSKQLRGGVIFMDSLPMTSSTKVDRQLLKKMVLTLPRE